MRLQPGIELVEHDAGLNRDLGALLVEPNDLPHVLREIDDQGRAHGLAALRCAGAARQDRGLGIACHVEGERQVGLVTRDYDADGLDLVDRGVRRISAARGLVEEHLALDGAAKGLFQRGHGGYNSEMRLNSHPSGRHFLQIPGPTNVPDRILRAMDNPTIDHRGPEFNALAKKVLRSVRQVFQTKQPVIVYPASGTGAWKAALVNTLSSADTVLRWETGHFAALWKKMADKLGIKSEFMGGDWRKPADPAGIGKRLKEDTG